MGTIDWFCSTASSFLFFFFNDTAPTEIYPLSLHAALPISGVAPGKRRFERLLVSRPPGVGVDCKPGLDDNRRHAMHRYAEQQLVGHLGPVAQHGHFPDRKSTRLNSITSLSRMPSSA